MYPPHANIVAPQALAKIPRRRPRIHAKHSIQAIQICKNTKTSSVQ